MRRALRSLVALLGIVVFLLGTLPGQATCALTDAHREADPHACCAGRSGAAAALLPAPAADEAEDAALCDGSCGEDVDLVLAEAAPAGPVALLGLPALAAQAPAPAAWPVLAARHRIVARPRGPPDPRPPPLPPFLTHRALLI